MEEDTSSDDDQYTTHRFDHDDLDDMDQQKSCKQSSLSPTDKQATNNDMANTDANNNNETLNKPITFHQNQKNYKTKRYINSTHENSNNNMKLLNEVSSLASNSSSLGSNTIKFLKKKPSGSSKHRLIRSMQNLFIRSRSNSTESLTNTPTLPGPSNGGGSSSLIKSIFVSLNLSVMVMVLALNCIECILILYLS